MEVHAIIAGIDEQIAKLTEARRILGGLSVSGITEKKPGRGRPKGSKNATTVAKTKGDGEPTKGKRKLSPEGRRRIAEAMKRRWAEKKTVD